VEFAGLTVASAIFLPASLFIGAAVAENIAIEWENNHNDLARREINMPSIKIDPNFAVFQAAQCECGF
jgi:hypothetical protein